jgi:hypothetical protein
MRIGLWYARRLKFAVIEGITCRSLLRLAGWLSHQLAFAPCVVVDSDLGFLKEEGRS